MQFEFLFVNLRAICIYKVELITNIIVEYLKHNKRIVVPKLGAFIVKQPSATIVFSELMRNDDGVLCSLLKAYGMNDLEANGAIDRFVFEIRFNTGKGDCYAVENLGVFCPGENNTISFKQKREPQTFGGSVTPPIETLGKQRIKQHQQTSISNAPETRRSEQTQRRTVTRHERHSDNNDSSTSLTMPDNYLRGLKYDKSKNKKREENLFNSGSRRTTNASRTIRIMLLAAVVVAAGGWFAWHKISQTRNEAATTKPSEQVVEPADSAQIIEAQSVEQTDSLTSAPQPIDTERATRVGTTNNDNTEKL